MVTRAPAAAFGGISLTPTLGPCCPLAPPDPAGISLALDATVAAEAPLSSLPDHPVTRALAGDSLSRRWLLPAGPRRVFACGDVGACGGGGCGDAVGRPGALTAAGLAEAVGVVADLTTLSGCVVQQINMMYVPYATVNGLTLGTLVSQATLPPPLYGAGYPPPVSPPSLSRFLLDEARGVMVVVGPPPGGGRGLIGSSFVAAVGDGDGVDDGRPAARPTRSMIELGGPGAAGVPGGALTVRRRVEFVGALAWAPAPEVRGQEPPTSPTDFRGFDTHVRRLLGATAVRCASPAAGACTLDGEAAAAAAAAAGATAGERPPAPRQCLLAPAADAGGVPPPPPPAACGSGGGGGCGGGGAAAGAPPPILDRTYCCAPVAVAALPPPAGVTTVLSPLTPAGGWGLQVSLVQALLDGRGVGRPGWTAAVSAAAAAAVASTAAGGWSSTAVAGGGAVGGWPTRPPPPPPPRSVGGGPPALPRLAPRPLACAPAGGGRRTAVLMPAVATVQAAAAPLATAVAATAAAAAPPPPPGVRRPRTRARPRPGSAEAAEAAARRWAQTLRNREAAARANAARRRLRQAAAATAAGKGGRAAEGEGAGASRS
ncbi:hypothetical protein BU14_0352s0004 [Porphyra umbilicalis]|uniref:Uncharacterized protein n=1 Tax=Porphyra umbilicalis TaxID=2786 RepID=A0A1X6NXW6_PORUM|nr:hypothetical protein BU14_0352s0004 [Porphyra umbilicalis]|eukprot:OSX73385.1 hypothetical protein BU14_0352s0004 [Porphyra umbilicalis]